MDYMPMIISVVLVVLTIVLTVVGVQLVMVLAEVKKTFVKLNTTLDTAETKFQALVSPLQNLGGMASGLRTGMKVFETFVGWLGREKER